MSNMRSSRGMYVQLIRELIGDDAWRARFALLSAIQRLPAEDVYQVLRELEDALNGPSAPGRRTPEELLQERFG